MTSFEQALHIFRKDARHLRWEIAGILLLLLIFVLTGIQTWEGLQEHGPKDSDTPLNVLLPVAWGLLIARAIQTEALPGDRHFWLTRPYSRTSLVLSKALFTAVFINLPFLLAQAVIVSLDGFPLSSHIGGLLWNQVLISVLLLLPIAALAALTRNLAQFLPAVVLLAGLLAVPVADHGSLGDMEWIRSSLGISIGVTIAALVLWRQYRLRRSGHIALIAAGCTVIGMILYLSFPASVAFAIQSRLIGSPDGKFALTLSEAGRPKEETKNVNRYRQLVALPIAVSGADPHDMRVESSSITFKTLSGITRHSSARADLVDQKLVNITSLDRTFFDAAKNSPVSLRAEFYLTQFGRSSSTEVPLDGTPVHIPGPGQCGVAVSYDQRTFVCRSVFRSPKPFLSERVARDSDVWPDSYSPFSVLPLIYPVVAQTYRLVGGGSGELAPSAPEPPATLVVRDPVAYFRYTMDTRNVRLGDFAINEPKEGSGQ